MHHDPDQTLESIRNADSIVVGQLGQTLDGRVATVTGESLYINGACALRHLHAMRAAVDALIVGVDTVALDNPRMTVRLVEGRTPVRVIIDPHGRVPGDSQCFQDDNGPVVVVRAAGVTPVTTIPDSVEIMTLTGDAEGHIAPTAVCEALAKRGLKRILIEGGPRTLSLAIEAGVVDALHVMVAPKLLGSGKPGFTLPPVPALDDALSPACETHVFKDGDVLFACDLRTRRETVVGFPG